MRIPTEELINKALREKEANQPKREINTWHISGLGGCLRGQYFTRQGLVPDYPVDDRLLRVFDMGNKLEDWLVGLLQTQKDVIKVETQIRVEDKKLNISGRADLILTFRNEKVLYEIKSKNSMAFKYLKKQGAQKSHIYQIWTYLYLTGIDLGVITYYSKDNQMIQEYEIRRDDENIKSEVMEVIKRLNRAWEEKNPALLPLPSPESWEARYCNHHKKCLAFKNNKTN